MKQQKQERQAQRLHELEELAEDEEGLLTMEHDWRHKGPGII